MERHAQRILVVEDEGLVRLALCDYLHDCGFHVLEAENADEALNILRRVGSHLDVVVSDIRMPGAADGFGLADWIHRYLPDLRVLLTSGDIGKSDRSYYLAPGDVFLAKPYSFDDVAAYILETDTVH